MGMLHSSSCTPADGLLLIIPPKDDSSLLFCGLHSHLIFEASSTQLPSISDWIQSQYNCDITLITVSNCLKSKDHMPIKKLLLLTRACSQQPSYATVTFACHCNFYSSPPKSFLSSFLNLVKPTLCLHRRALLHPICYSASLFLAKSMTLGLGLALASLAG